MAACAADPVARGRPDDDAASAPLAAAAGNDAAAHDLAAAVAACLPPGTHMRAVAAPRLVGRDLRESRRVVCLDWRCIDAAPHLRELWAQTRPRVLITTAAVGLADDPLALAAIRRYAGRVAVTDAAEFAALRIRLLTPVHHLFDDMPRRIAALLQFAPGAEDSVAALLLEARVWLARGEPRAAFGAAARCLKLAPDQPGVVADVARLLALLADRERAAELCRHFLDQRPDAEVVRAALAEVLQFGRNDAEAHAPAPGHPSALPAASPRPVAQHCGASYPNLPSISAR
ncbi:MAG: hypothetical protein AB7O97_16975 [Planctomycetota bacterium]